MSRQFIAQRVHGFERYKRRVGTRRKQRNSVLSRTLRGTMQRTASQIGNDLADRATPLLGNGFGGNQDIVIYRYRSH